MSEPTQQNETSKAVLEAFTFIKSGDETLNERVHAMASLLHTAAMMVIKSESRKGEGFECIKYLELASWGGPVMPSRLPIEKRFLTSRLPACHACLVCYVIV